MEAVQETHAICEAAICYTGDILDPKRDEVFAEVLREAGEGTGKDGRAHPRASRTWPGLCRPYAAQQAGEGAEGGNRHCRSISTRTTPAASAPASVLRASDAGVDIVDLAIASMSGRTSQPNLNSIVAALQHTPRDTGLDLDGAERVLRLLGTGPRVSTHPFDTAPQDRQRRGLSARDARRPVHESQGAGRAAWAWRIAGRKSPAPTPR